MTDDLRTNVYWSVTVLGDAQQRPNRITAARDRATDIAAITREEVTALARRHLPVTRAFKFATLPVTPAQAAAKTGTGSAASPAPSARAP